MNLNRLIAFGAALCLATASAVLTAGCARPGWSGSGCEAVTHWNPRYCQ